MPHNDVLQQTTLRVPRTLLKKAKYILDLDDSSLNESCVKHLEQLVHRWEKRVAAQAPPETERSTRATPTA